VLFNGLTFFEALLACVTSSSCSVHGSLLLNVFKTLYNIYLQTQSPVNTTTAKGGIIQIVNTIFQRFIHNYSTPMTSSHESGSTAKDQLKQIGQIESVVALSSLSERTGSFSRRQSSLDIAREQPTPNSHRSSSGQTPRSSTSVELQFPIQFDDDESESVDSSKESR
jgi:hypothetical protein